MSGTQKIINEMLKGDTNAIEHSVNSGSPILILNAIIYGVRNNLRTPSFREGLEKAAENEEILMGCQICQFAKAARHLLNIAPYEGDNKRINDLISCSMLF